MNPLQLTKLSNFSNLDESFELTKKLNTFNNTELADMINQNKSNEFKLNCGNYDNITFRKESNRNNQSKNSNNNNSIKDYTCSKNNIKMLNIPQEEEELIFHDVAEKDTEDRNKELINQIGELKNSVISDKDKNKVKYANH
jgi:hypothetical protein